MTDVIVQAVDRPVVTMLSGGLGPSVYDLWRWQGNTGSLEDFFSDMIDAAALTVSSAPGQVVGSRALLAAIVGPVDGQAAFLAETYRHGLFVFDDSDLSAQVTGDPEEGLYVAPNADDTGASGAWVRRYNGNLRADWFGAAGDGVVDDTDAFLGIAALVNAADGGCEIDLRPGATYRVGRQTFAGTTGLNYAYAGTNLLHFTDCTRAIRLNGRGACIKLLDGLKFGAFDPVTGDPHGSTVGPFVDEDYIASIGAMIRADNCSGGLTISGPLELDGNMAELELGGIWTADVGDTISRQLNAYGFFLNGTPATIDDVYTHHHGLDGYALDHTDLGEGDEGAPVKFRRVRSHYNARQGCSWVGGRAVSWDNCDFSHTGKGTIASAPRAGLDIEAEGTSICRDGQVTNCRFADNAGAGMVASEGDSSDVSFQRCRFIGTTGYAAWPAKPGFKFEHCLFVGAVTNPYSSADADRATQFVKCRFTADEDLSPTGSVFLNVDQLLDFGGVAGTNVLLEDCTVDTGGNTDAVLGTTAVGVRYRNTTMLQDGTGTANISGTFEGLNDITSAGTVSVAAQDVRQAGALVINGESFPAYTNEIQANDGITFRRMREGIWFDPTAWATLLGGTTEGEFVRNPEASSPVMGWRCTSADGTDPADWEAFIRVLQGAPIASASDLATAITAINAVLAWLRSFGGIQT